MCAKKAFCLLVKRLWASSIIFSVSSEGRRPHCVEPPLQFASMLTAYPKQAIERWGGQVSKLLYMCRMQRGQATDCESARALILHCKFGPAGGAVPRNHELQGCRHPQGQGQQQLACLIITSKLTQ